MKFRTEYHTQPNKVLINPEHSVVLLGSCFTDNIGDRMRTCRWRAYPNLLGTLYNPASIGKIIKLACNLNHIDMVRVIEDSLVERDNLWMSWLSDSGCTTYSSQETEDRVLSCLLDLQNKLKEAKTLIVTFGTSWIYELKECPGYIVSNCHKFSSDTFVRRRLSISEIVEMWTELLDILITFNPQLRIIFTVSPVRHLKDGFEGNSRSKAILQLACDEICKTNNYCDYFPAFEIMNDDLRDYRYYASDLVHPSDFAVDYIWQKFQDTYLSQSSRNLLAAGEKVTKRLQHRPIIYGNSEEGKHAAARQEYEASQIYNEFIASHPSML